MKPELTTLLPAMALFVAVAKAKNFSRAARALGMPVSTLSRRVAELERAIGVQLLVRTTRQVALTLAGATYFERCREVLDAAAHAHAEVQGEANNPRGLLRISATADFVLTFLTPFLTEFAERYPHITFALDLTPRSVDLIAEGFDVAIRMGPLPDSQLVARKLGWSPRGLFASPSYLARAGTPKKPADLSRHECLRLLLAGKGETTWSLTRDNRSVDVAVAGRFVANSIRFLLQLALQGRGIALMDAAVARPEVAAGALVPVLPSWSPSAVLVHALTPSRLLPAKTKLFLAGLAHHVAWLARDQVS